jgi:hypothetical protein
MEAASYPEALVNFHLNTVSKTKNNSVALASKQTIPAERPPLVGKFSGNFFLIEGVAWSV